MRCTYCGGTELQKRGLNDTGNRQRYFCKKCHRFPTAEITQCNLHAPAKILLFDIETLFLQVYVGSLKHNDYISPNNIIKDWCVLSWSAKWLFDDKIYGEVLTSQEAVNCYDYNCLQGIWKLLDEADIAIGHNSDKFDHKKLNTRFLVGEMYPPSYYKTIDTLKIARDNFAFSSNKLDFINDALGIHQKSPTDMDLWKRCSVGDSVALQKMLEYNKNDVVILEELYVKFRPWIKNHPSMKSYLDIKDDVCSNCGCSDLIWGGWYRTNVNKYRAFRCGECGALGRSTKKS